MTKPTDSPESLLSRWSRRKHEAAREKSVPAAAPAIVPPVEPVATPVEAPAAPVAEPLPPVESLTLDSDFTAFMSPKVDEDVKRAALRKLFSDPRFNVMDGLDVYIDDYSKPDPMPDGLLEKLADVYKTLTEDAPKEVVANDDAVEVPATVAAAPAVPDPVPSQPPPDDDER